MSVFFLYALFRTSGSCIKLEQNFPYTENLLKLSVTEILALLISLRIDKWQRKDILSWMQLWIKSSTGNHVAFLTTYLLNMAMNLTDSLFQSSVEIHCFLLHPKFCKNINMMSAFINMAPFHANIFSVKQLSFPFSYSGDCGGDGKNIWTAPKPHQALNML